MKRKNGDGWKCLNFYVLLKILEKWEIHSNGAHVEHVGRLVFSEAYCRTVKLAASPPAGHENNELLHWLNINIWWSMRSTIVLVVGNKDSSSQMLHLILSMLMINAAAGEAAGARPPPPGGNVDMRAISTTWSSSVLTSQSHMEWFVTSLWKHVTNGRANRKFNISLIIEESSSLPTNFSHENNPLTSLWRPCWHDAHLMSSV